MNKVICSVINTIYGPGIATIGKPEVLVVKRDAHEDKIKRDYENKNRHLGISWVPMDEFFDYEELDQVI